MRDEPGCPLVTPEVRIGETEREDGSRTGGRLRARPAHSRPRQAHDRRGEQHDGVGLTRKRDAEQVSLDDLHALVVGEAHAQDVCPSGITLDRDEAPGDRGERGGERFLARTEVDSDPRARVARARQAGRPRRGCGERSDSARGGALRAGWCAARRAAAARDLDVGACSVSSGLRVSTRTAGAEDATGVRGTRRGPPQAAKARASSRLRTCFGTRRRREGAPFRIPRNR